MRQLICWVGFLIGLPAWSAEITLDQARALRDQFVKERQEAAARFASSRLEPADRAAARGESALAAQRPVEAAAAFRQARWLLPAYPSSVPPHARALIVPRLQHGDAVLAIAYSPDGTRLASASKDKTVKIWDLSNGRELFVYRDHQEAVRAVAWDPHGKFIVTAGGNEVRMWNPADGSRIRSWKNHTRTVNTLAIRPDGQQVASGGDDRNVFIWDVSSDQPVLEFGAKEFQAPVQSVAWSPNGKLLACLDSGGTSPGTLRVYEPEAEAAKRLRFSATLFQSGAYQVVFSPDGRHLAVCGERSARWYDAPNVGGTTDGSVGVRRHEFSGHGGLVAAIAISPDGKYLATGSADHLVRIWEVGVPDRPIRVLQGHDDQINSLAFSPDGRHLASASFDQSVRLWPLQVDDSHRQLVGHDRPVWSVAARPDGQQIASASADRRVILWDAATGTIQHRLEGHRLPVTTVLYSPDGETVVSGGGDKVLKVWQSRTGAWQRDLSGHDGAILAAAFTPDGNHLLSGSADKTVRVWSITTGEGFVLGGHRSAVSSIAVRPDGKVAAVGCVDGGVVLWNLETKQQLGSFSAHQEGVSSLAYTPDGRLLISGGTDRLVMVWEFPPGQVAVAKTKWTGHGGPVGAVSVSPDGRFAASGSSDATIKVWDLLNRQELRTLRGHGDWVSSLVFVPKHRTIASASVDRTVRLWELFDEPGNSSTGHVRGLRAVAVSSDGRWLATGGDDQTIRIWELATGLERRLLTGHTQDIQSLAFLPGSTRLVSGGRDQRLRVWDVETGREIANVQVPHRIPALLGLPDGKRFVAWQLTVRSDNDSVSVLQTLDADGKVETTHTDQGRNVSCLAFSVDGTWAVSGDTTGNLRLVNVATGERIGSDLPVFSRSVADVAFSADKTLVMAGGNDGEVKIVDIATREVKHTIAAHPSGLLALVAAPEGPTFVTLGRDGFVKLFDSASGQALREWNLGVQPRAAAFAPDRKSLIVANADASVFVLDLP